MKTESARVEASGWSGGEWVASVELRDQGDPLRVLPEPGWPAPERAANGSHTLYLDGSAYLEERGRDRRLDARDLLAMYVDRGDALLPDLRGTFAVLVWDAKHNSLVAGRDPLGTHPLFYAHIGQRLSFSPSLQALIRAGGVPATVDPVFLALRLIQLPADPEETFFKTIRRIPAGHLLRADRRALRVWRAWDPLGRPADASVDAEEATGRFGDLMRTAVDRCLRGQRGAVFLSGGLDSAAVAASAAAVSRQQSIPEPIALSFISSDPAANEERTQRAVASALELPHVALTVADAVGNASLLASALALNRTKSGLLASPLHPIYDALAHRAGEFGCEVALTGEGGDEWLLPRPEYLADRMRRFDAFGFLRLARAWYGYYPIYTKLDFSYGVLWKWGARRLLRAAAGATLQRWAPDVLRTIRSGRFVEQLPPWMLPEKRLKGEVTARAVALRREPAPRDLYRQARRELLDHPNLAEFCEEAFSAQRRLGIAVRAPFLDASLVEFLLRLPESILIRDGMAKWLARRALPPSVSGMAFEWPRTTYGDSFFRDAVRKEAAGVWRDLGGAPLLAELGVVDGRALNQAFKDLENGFHTGTGEDLWHVLTLETWLQSHILSPSGRKGE